MNWFRLSPTESTGGNARGQTTARVWFTGAGWFGAMGGKQSPAFDDESAAREWAECEAEMKI